MVAALEASVLADRGITHSLVPLQLSEVRETCSLQFGNLLGPSSYVLCECSSIQISRAYTKACPLDLCSVLHGMVFLLVVTALF